MMQVVESGILHGLLLRVDWNCARLCRKSRGVSTERYNASENLNLEIMEMPYWYRRVFLLAIPLILSNLTQPLLSMVDTILSGHLPGAAALGGVAVAGIFFNTNYWTFGFLRISSKGLVAQAHGAEEHDQLRLLF